MPTLFTSLPLHFGWRAPRVESLEGTAVQRIEDHGDDGVDLLLPQFKGKERIEAILRALLAGVQDVDDAIWQVLSERGLDWGVGVQLDAIGRMIDLPRTGWHDDTYRVFLRAHLLVLRSNGRWPEILAILEALGLDLSLLATSEPGTAEFRIVTDEYLDGDVAPEDVYRLIARAKGAGIRFVLEYPASELADAFTFSSDEDDVEADAARGWANDAQTAGGVLGGSLATSEAA
jgi:hypothetical protein